MSVTKQIIIGGSSSSPATTGTRYTGLMASEWSTVEFSRAQLISSPGKLRNLQFKVAVAPGGGKSWTFTLRKNGVDTDLVSNIADTEVISTINTEEVTVEAGDSIAISAVGTGTPAEPEAVYWSCDFSPTISGETVLLSSSSGTNLVIDNFQSIISNKSPDTLEFDAQILFPTAGTLKKFYVELSVAPGSGVTRTFAVRVNGGSSPVISVDIAGTAKTGNNTADTLTIAAGDSVAILCTESGGTPAGSPALFGLTFVPTTEGEFIAGAVTDDALNNSTTEYIPITCGDTTLTATESEQQNLCVAETTVKNMYVKLNADPGTSPDRYTFTLRKNAADTGLTVTIQADDTAGNATSDVSISAADLLDTSIIPGNTPSATPRMQISYLLYNAPISLPTVTTQAVTDISNPLATATGNGNITDTGGDNVLVRGFVFSASSHSLPGDVDPSSSGYESNVKDAGSFGSGAYTKQLINLKLQPPSGFSTQEYQEDGNYYCEPGSKMKIRVYSYWTSEAGRVYSTDYLESNEIGSDIEYWRGHFVWGAVSGVTGYRVLLNYHDGISWSGWTSGDDYTSNDIIIDATQLDTGKTAITPSSSTTYYVRSYARNLAGYSYGGEVTFSESGGGYTLTVTAGSFILTGVASSLLAARKFDITSGSFVLTGIDLSLLAARKLDMATGSFALTGIDLSLLTARKLGITKGSFALTGIDLSLLTARKLGITPGSFILTGINSSLLAARIFGISPGSFILTGNDAELKLTLAGYTLTITPASFVLTGIDLSLKTARKLGISPGSFILTGLDCIIQRFTGITEDRRYAKESWDSLERVWKSGEKVNPFGKNIFTKHL